MNKIKKIKKMYEELLNVYNKYSDEDFFNDYMFDDVKKWQSKALNHLKIIDWNDKYWIDIKHDRDLSGNYIKISEYTYFYYFKDAMAEKEKWYWRYISRSDDWKQPKDEWLFKIEFPTGAYIFGSDYPCDLFNRFFNELKSYWPKYTDTNNKSLYFWMDNVKKIFNEFDNILKKYNEINKEEYKQRKIKRMEEELLKLRD